MGLSEPGVFRQADDMNAFAFLNVGVGIGKNIQFAAARADFLQIGFEFFQQRVVGRDGDHRHVLVHQRERAMLQFAGGVGFGVDVGNFLELERAFHGDGIMHAAPEK